MDNAEDYRRAAAGEAPRTADAFLAGLEAATLGTLWMLAWMGFSAAWQRRSFWTAENLLANAYHPNGAIPAGFGWSSISGLALYLLLYGLLGAVFAMLRAGHRPSPVGTMMLAMIFALAWYYFSFHLLWRAVSPAISFLHAERSTIAGHLIYGLSLGRFYSYFRPAEKPPSETVAQETPSDPVAPGA